MTENYTYSSCYTHIGSETKRNELLATNPSFHNTFTYIYIYSNNLNDYGTNTHLTLTNSYHPTIFKRAVFKNKIKINHEFLII